MSVTVNTKGAVVFSIFTEKKLESKNFIEMYHRKDYGCARVGENLVGLIFSPLSFCRYSWYLILIHEKEILYELEKHVVGRFGSFCLHGDERYGC
jgi:hypothetical protein